MYSLLLGLHIIVCLLLVIIVLLQSGKAADLAGAFGGMGSQSTFGPRGTATFLSKMTTTLAVLFMVTSLSLWIFASDHSGPKTVVDGQEQATPTPVTTDTDTNKVNQTGDTTEQQQDTDKPAASTSETETSGENTATDSKKNESGQELPPESSNSKQ